VHEQQTPYSFQDVYDLYWEKVYLQCFHHLGDHETAKDMTQDIFRSLWERFDDLEITTSIEFYLAKAAKLKVFEYIRNETVKRKHIQTFLYDTETADNSVEENVEYKELYNHLISLIALLPKQCKTVFTLSKINGLSNKEIAMELNISERAVEYHITKAYLFIRKKIAKYCHLLVFFAIFVLSFF